MAGTGQISGTAMAPRAAQGPSPTGWRRMVANLTAFAEATEMDITSQLELRIARLEQRIAQLEAGTTRS